MLNWVKKFKISELTGELKLYKTARKTLRYALFLFYLAVVQCCIDSQMVEYTPFTISDQATDRTAKVYYQQTTRNFSLSWSTYTRAKGYVPYCSEGTGASLPGDKNKNVWSSTSTSSYSIMAWCLMKHGDNFSFTSHLKKETGFYTHTYTSSVMRFID